jgi:arylsulfatase A-like enzyme
MTGELALLDRKIERTKTLERLGVLENTLMMIGADHG